MFTQKKLQRQNVESAEQMGLLDHEKLAAGAPLDWKLVTLEEVPAIEACGLPVVRRLNTKIQGPVAMGWTPNYVYDMIVKWEELGEKYADLTLEDWLRKTIGNK